MRCLIGAMLVIATAISSSARSEDETDPLRLHQLHFYHTDPIRAAIGTPESRCANPCVITRNSGGFFEVFLKAARELVQTDMRVIVDGQCISSCVLLADYARTHVCITQNASMFLHKGTTKSGHRVDPPHSRDIDAWVQWRGGYPTEGFLEMKYESAKYFWHTCNSSSLGFPAHY